MIVLGIDPGTAALGYGIVAPAIPEFAREFGVSAAAAASVVSAFALMRVIGALPAGRLVDRFGEHKVMAVGIAIVAVSSLFAGFSGSFVQLIVLRGAGGLGSAMYTVSAQTLLLTTVPEPQRALAAMLPLSDLPQGWALGTLGQGHIETFNAENLFVSGPTSNSPTTGNQLFNGSGPGGLNPNVGVPDSQLGTPRTGQISLRLRF